MKFLIILITFLLMSGCFEDKSTQLGKIVFEKNCAVCHGKQAQGLTKNWKKRQADGKFPAPPLNGSAHAWHHSPKLLMSTINNGGAKLGGWMPGFKDTLSEAEKQAVLDYIYSLWDKNIQQKYDKRFN